MGQTTTYHFMCSCCSAPNVNLTSLELFVSSNSEKWFDETFRAAFFFSLHIFALDIQSAIFLYFCFVCYLVKFRLYSFYFCFSSILFKLFINNERHHDFRIYLCFMIICSFFFPLFVLLITTKWLLTIFLLFNIL